MFLPPVERVKEAEIGADFAFSDRAQFSLTAYSADASHLYAFQTIGGGFGAPPSTNAGSVRNQGIRSRPKLNQVRLAESVLDGAPLST